MYTPTNNDKVNEIYKRMCLYFDNISRTAQRSQIGNSVHQYYNMSGQDLLTLFDKDYNDLVDPEYRYDFDKMYSHFAHSPWNTKISTEELVGMIRNVVEAFPGIDVQVDGVFGAYTHNDEYIFMVQIDSIRIIASNQYDIGAIKGMCEVLNERYKLHFVRYEDHYKMMFSGPNCCIL